MSALGTVAVGFVGTGIGWLLTRQTAKDVREWSKEDAKKARVWARETEAADGFNRALLEIVDIVRDDGIAAQHQLEDAYKEWATAWVRSTVIPDGHELNERYRAVGQIIDRALREMRYAPDGAQFKLNRLIRATTNARRAVTAFVREEELPPRTFPSSDQLKALVTTDARDPDCYKKLDLWLMANPEPA